MKLLQPRTIDVISPSVAGLVDIVKQLLRITHNDDDLLLEQISKDIIATAVRQGYNSPTLSTAAEVQYNFEEKEQTGEGIFRPLHTDWQTINWTGFATAERYNNEYIYVQWTDYIFRVHYTTLQDAGLNHYYVNAIAYVYENQDLSVFEVVSKFFPKTPTI